MMQSSKKKRKMPNKGRCGISRPRQWVSIYLPHGHVALLHIISPILFFTKLWMEYWWKTYFIIFGISSFISFLQIFLNQGKTPYRIQQRRLGEWLLGECFPTKVTIFYLGIWFEKKNFTGIFGLRKKRVLSSTQWVHYGKLW